MELEFHVKNDDPDANLDSRNKYATDMPADQSDSKTC